MFDDYEKKDIEVLAQQIGSTSLPPILDYFKNIEVVMDKIDEHALSIFDYDGELCKLNSSVHIPKYVFHKGAESIDYFTFKNNLSKRAMGVANPVWFFSFIFNMIIANRTWIEAFYHDESMAKVRFHSNSPILGRINRLEFAYGDGEVGEEVAVQEFLTGITNEKNSKSSKAFKINQQKSMQIESTKPFYLKVDIENYFRNIYTHQFEKIGQQLPFRQYETENSFVRRFFAFLDNYNMAINNNHTKGILQGPISSSISAEFIGLFIDTKIEEKLDEDVDYFRYVDDFTFFSTDNSKLEAQIEYFDRLLRPLELSRKGEKTVISNGFPPEKRADLAELFSKVEFLTQANKIWISQEDILGFRYYLSGLMENKNIPQIRALLTITTRYMDRAFNKAFIHNNDTRQSIYMVPMLLKLVYSLPVVADHVYRLLDILLKHSTKREAGRILQELVNNTDYVEEHFAETNVQIWHFYLLFTYLKANDKRKLLKKVLTRITKDPQGTDPLILGSIISDDFSVNYSIYRHIKNTYMMANNQNPQVSTNLQGIGYSKWWPNMLRLHEYIKRQEGKPMKTKSFYTQYRKMRKSIVGLFGTKNEPKLDEMGIYMYLL
ncbi:RNA-directed DNA polymerase [Lactiplantibacillus plantarum]|uniref:RNA-directed DNA polymerase n=1 Tax=Lactiplantibacillus plantarum TaxID=1590 RepID=A0AAX1K9G5_LACPN|nr:RNA-directed DNA polymerase [Lactiplantibacillus plantarum]AUS72691.1 hypothetical protein C1T23_02004 [Lactiplantibacillus plantarum]KZU35037.1 hypothetical protein Nizo2535_0876 [Lactiplantibacillus plantarum]KZU76031.1 hypothetical protein Nizo2891_2659 [Lactiplantibacillus plantarum]MBC6381690.1 RNA-directed DNA polymerase [Lactiplantibacillus plantarum]MCG0833007.1 hypothetical protein [Lactiplantibacillus plantarum]